MWEDKQLFKATKLKHFPHFIFMYFVTLKCFGFVKNLGVLIFMTLVYDNTTCEQAIFTYAFSGQNLNNDNIVFTVKKLVSNFKRDFPLLFKDDIKTQGRPKEYYLDELLGFIILWSL